MGGWAVGWGLGKRLHLKGRPWSVGSSEVVSYISESTSRSLNGHSDFADEK